MHPGVVVFLVLSGIMLGAVALAWVITFIWSYVAARKLSIGRIGFGTFKALYNAKPGRWRLEDDYVESTLFEPCLDGWSVVSDRACYYFSLPDYIRYLRWKKMRDEQREKERNNAQFEKHIKAWQEDLTAYEKKLRGETDEPNKNDKGGLRSMPSVR